MKNGKKPTLAQKKFLQGKGLVPENWLIVKDTPVELVVVSRAALLKRTGKTRTFRKERLGRSWKRRLCQCRKIWKESGTR